MIVEMQMKNSNPNNELEKIDSDLFEEGDESREDKYSLENSIQVHIYNSQISHSFL